ncbi:MAG: T9SS type A sorting domain-containing protein, partial [Hydrotalea sp.]|nr:T9SS type A sorting domain-containing protein [Hydrotalea sp.]
DVTSVVFSIEVNGANTAVNTTLGKVGFTKVDVDYLRSLEAKDVQLYPNPSNGRFTIQFRSAVEAPLTMRMTDAATGRVVMSRAIQAVQGENQVTVEMGRSSQGLYIVNLDGANGLRYKPAKISIKR